MKNLKNIIASIILVVISFVSYTQDILKYEFYLDSTDITVDTFTVTNTVTHNKYSLSTNTWDLGKLGYNMNFSMDSTIYKGDNVECDSAYVTKIYLFKNDIEYQNSTDALTNVVTGIDLHIYLDPTSIVEISSIGSLIPTLIDSLKNGVKYENLIFEINDGDKYVNVAIDYHLAAEDTTTTSIDTEVIEVSNTRVYPNPVMNSLNIEFETINTDTEVEIYSTNGQLMYKDVEYRNFGINKVSVDMSNYQPGMYIVKLGNVVKKVIKQ